MNQTKDHVFGRLHRRRKRMLDEPVNPVPAEEIKFDAETRNANYLFSGDIHIKHSKNRNRAHIADAFIFETGHFTYDNFNLPSWADKTIKIQYRGLLSDNVKLEEPKPIYFVDIPPSRLLQKHEKLANVAYIATGLVTLGTIPVALSAMSPPESMIFLAPWVQAQLFLAANLTNSQKLKKVASYTGLSLLYSPLVGARSAASAEKIETAIAPALRDKLGRKPNIYISFGAGHVDMLAYLKHKNLRRGVIELHKTIHYFPGNPEYLDIVGEVTFGKEGLNLGKVLKESDGVVKGRKYKQKVFDIYG